MANEREVKAALAREQWNDFIRHLIGLREKWRKLQELVKSISPEDTQYLPIALQRRFATNSMRLNFTDAADTFVRLAESEAGLEKLLVIIKGEKKCQEQT